MAVRNIRQSWWIDIRHNHTRYRKRSPENSKAGAEAYEALLRQKLARGESISQPKNEETDQLTFEQFVRKWFKEYVAANNKYSEQRTKKYILDAALIPFFGSTAIDKITARQIEQFKVRQLNTGIKHKTLNNRLTVLRTCLSAAQEWLGLENVPKIKWLKYPPAQTDYLTQEECDLLLSHAEGMVYEMLLTALRTGMRQGELKALQWSSIDWQNGIITVRHSWSDYLKSLEPPKSNRERHIPLDAELYEVLYRRKKKTGFVFSDEDGKPFNNNRLERLLTTACKRAGLRRITWHILRHTFASHLAMANVPLNSVQALLGHSNINTTMRYAHFSESGLRTAIDALNARRADKYLGQQVGNRRAPTFVSEHEEKVTVPKNL